MWRYVHARTIARVWPRLKPAAPDHSAALAHYLRRLIAPAADFPILQVGAFDGVSNDHVHDLIADFPQVRATLLEPQPAPFAALAGRWRDEPRVTPLQCALADRVGERALYTIASAHRHRHPFPDQVASFDRAHVEIACARYVWRPTDDFVTSIAVPTIDWPTLVARHGPFAFVAIDAEGYDGEILHQIDFRHSAPEVILYEHRHLTREMKSRCEALLGRHGYVVRRVNKTDTVATRGPALHY